jgi:hypothetical protein
LDAIHDGDLTHLICYDYYRTFVFPRFCTPTRREARRLDRESVRIVLRFLLPACTLAELETSPFLEKETKPGI